MYNNIGSEQKFGKAEPSGGNTLLGKSHGELSAVREQMIQDGLIEREPTRKMLEEKYGDIDSE